MKIVEFLEVRIAEDEAVARKCEDSGPWYTWRSDQNLEWWVQSENFGHVVTTGYFGNSDARPNAEHIAAHDPARVLSECAAKRRTLEALRSYEPADEWYVHPDMGTRGNNAAGAVRAMAVIYKDHPDYQQEWAL